MHRPPALAVTLLSALVLAACHKSEPPPPPAAQPALPALSPVQAPPVAAVSPTAPEPVASSDVDNPTPLPKRTLSGHGLKQSRTYYYSLNANPGTIKITATAKNEPSGATNALTVALQDAKGVSLCRDTWGNTTKDKTQTIDCSIDKAQPVILRIDLSEETIDYSLTLDGPFDLPAATAAATSASAGPGSTDIDAPTRLTTNRVKGSGTQAATSYYYAFNAGPGELTLTGDGRNDAAATTNALATGLYTLRNERLCEVSLGNTTRDKRGVATCKLDQRQPVILRVDLAPETVEWRVKFDGPYDFKDFTPPKEVTIALDAAVLFDTGRWELKPESRQTLHEAAERVKKFADAPVAITGHTDNVGSEAANQTLSEKRAAAVRDWFVQQEGVPPNRLSTKGYGKTRPVADNGTDQGRARNRRVDVEIRPAAR